MRPYRTFGKTQDIGIYRKKVKYWTDSEFNICVNSFDCEKGRHVWTHRQACRDEAEAIDIATALAQDAEADRALQRRRAMSERW